MRVEFKQAACKIQNELENWWLVFNFLFWKSVRGVRLNEP